MKQIYEKDFVPRLKAPTSSDKWYSDSWSPCIPGKPLAWKGSVLSNCVGYAFGRFAEIAGMSASECKLGKTAGVDWPQSAIVWYTQDRSGYKKGQTPKVGACACFIRKDKAFGHVQIVEQVKADGTIVCSRSDYGGTTWYLQTLKPPYSYGSGNSAEIFQGFIYNPAILDNPKEEPKPVEEPKKEEVKPEEVKKEPVPQFKYKVGDRVKIVKAGNASRDGSKWKAGGLGWVRYVLSVKPGAYPYQIGALNGVTTGFYKEDGITKA